MRVRDWHDEDDYGFDPTADTDPSYRDYDESDKWYPFSDEAEARRVLENPDAFAEEWAEIDAETERGLWELLDRTNPELRAASPVRNAP